VTGATWPEELGQVRAVVGDMPLLVPGIGAQGGDIGAVMAHGRTADGTGLMISSSRAILYASAGSDFAEVAHRAADEMRKSVNSFR
jgi:orotidine-5'-phosphate decarboxylase